MTSFTDKEIDSQYAETEDERNARLAERRRRRAVIEKAASEPNPNHATASAPPPRLVLVREDVLKFALSLANDRAAGGRMSHSADDAACIARELRAALSSAPEAPSEEMVERAARASFACWRKRMTEQGRFLDKGRTFEDMNESEQEFARLHALTVIVALLAGPR